MEISLSLLIGQAADDMEACLRLRGGALDRQWQQAQNSWGAVEEAGLYIVDDLVYQVRHDLAVDTRPSKDTVESLLSALCTLTRCAEWAEKVLWSKDPPLEDDSAELQPLEEWN
jgi:hypothetical protein